MNAIASNGGWYPPGEFPVRGQEYEFEDFVGGRFVGTFERLSSHYGASGLGGTVLSLDAPERAVLHLRLEFSDRDAFETNVPLRFRNASSRALAGSGVGDTE